MRNPTPLILTPPTAVTAIVLFFFAEKAPKEKEAPTPQETANTQPGKTQITPTPWPSEKSDIPADPAALFGSLPNGFRYLILPNEEPPKRLSMRLHIAAGSLMEADDQRGLAHFLEHMVFNGTKNFKDANALIQEMRSRGIAFGAHVNAYTSFDETVYMFDVPDLKPNTLDLTFRTMRDFADGALLSTEEINAERGVILSEKASRDSVSYRMMQQQFSSLLPKSLITQRFPIGQEEVIKNAPRERFTDFYSKYYIPSKMTFVIVGAFDPAEIEKKITQTFSSMKNPETPGTDPELGEITVPQNLETHVFSDPELSSTDVSITLVRPYEILPDTTENRLAKFPIQIANYALGRRFNRLSKKENSPITEGSASKYALFNEIEIGSIDVTVADDRWQEAVPILDQEFRRALKHGFTPAELAEAKAELLNAYQEAVKRAPTRKSESLATAIASSINERTVFSTPETNLEIASQALSEITPENVLTDFTEFWNAPGYHLILSTNNEPEGATEILTAAYKKSATTAVEPPAAREIVPFAYTVFGPAGTIDTQTEIEDLEVTQLTLSNNIRVNLKQTDFEKNKILFLARIGTGQLSQPANTPLLDGFATAIFEGGGLGAHSNDELSEILAGRNVSSSLSIGEDALTLSGTSTPEDQLLQLQLMVANLTDPGYRPEALWQFQKQIPVLFQQLKHTTGGPMKELQGWLHGSDFRYTLPDQTQLSNYTIDQVKTWLTPQLESSYLELTIVGDFKKEKILTDLLATFGTLPERDPSLPENPQNPRTVSFPERPASKEFTYQSKIPQAVATAVWKTQGIRDNIPQFRRLNVLSDIYGDRLRQEIREKLGASYSPNAGATGSDALEDFGYLIGQSIGKPQDLPLLLDTMEQIAADLAENGVKQDELDRSLAPTLKQLEKSTRDNSYWLSTVLAQSQAEPKRLEYARTRDTDYKSISLKEINSLATRYFPKKNLLKTTILPKE